MHYVMCSVRDLKSEVFGTPFCMRSVGVAIRSFDEEVNRKDENNMMFKHPADFHLFQIGEYSDLDASIVSMQPKLLVTGDQVIRKDFSLPANGVSVV